MSLDAPSFRPTHGSRPTSPNEPQPDPFTNGPPSHQPQQGPMSDSLSVASRAEFARQDSSKAADEVEADEGDGEADGAEGSQQVREGKLITERARLRRMASHPIPSPPLESAGGSPPFSPKSTSTELPARPPPLRRRSSHPDMVPKSNHNHHHHAHPRKAHVPSRPPLPATEPSSEPEQAPGFKRSTKEEWRARGLPSVPGQLSSHKQPGWGMMGAGPRVLPGTFFGAQADGTEDDHQLGNTSSAADPTSSSGDGEPGAGSGETRASHRPSRRRKSHVNPDDESPIDNLPDMSSGTGDATDDGAVKKTSFPTKDVQANLDISMRDLVSKDVLAQLLDEESGRDRFKEWIRRHSTSPDALATLEFYCDVSSYLKFVDETQSLGLALQETFLNSDATRPTLHLSASTDAESSSTAHTQQNQQHKATSPFVTASEKALDVLYKEEFSKFLQYKIVEQAKVRLGLFANLKERGDLSDVFCLTNPRLPDHPIVMVSDGFTRLTEYSWKQILGRNCRFLQGPSTDPESVRRIREAIAAGKPCCEILLNYKRSGEPFFNLLSIIPLRAPSGRIDYFLSGQCDISAALASPKTLAFLIGADQPLQQNGVEVDNGPQPPPPPPKSDLRISKSVLQRVEEQTGRKSVFTEAKASTFGVGGTQERRMFARPDGSGSPSPTPKGLPQVHRKKGEHVGVYSRMLVVRASPKTEIMFVTTPLLEMLGYPFATPKQAYNSPLLHRDFTELLVLPTRQGTKQLQASVRTAVVEQEVSYSVRAGLLHSANGRRRPGFRNEEGLGFSMGLMHLTPLKDAEGIIDCFCVVFGT